MRRIAAVAVAAVAVVLAGCRPTPAFVAEGRQANSGNPAFSIRRVTQITELVVGRAGVVATGISWDGATRSMPTPGSRPTA